MQPDENDTSLDEAYHRLLAKVLQVKKPRIILQCNRDVYKDDWMKRFYFGATEYSFKRYEVAIDQSHTVALFQSFHPSCAVNNTECRPEFRALLIHHFLAAFGALCGRQSDLPDYVQRIQQLCNKTGERLELQKLKLLPWQAAGYIEIVIYEEYSGPKDHGFLCFVDDSEIELIQRRLYRLDRMYSALKWLAIGDLQCAPGSLAISKIITFFWKVHFEDEPIYEQVLFMLQTRGNEQESWFGPIVPTKNPRKSATILDDMAALSLNDFSGNSSDQELPNHETIALTMNLAKAYLRQTTAFELASALDIANGARCCQTMVDGSVDPKSIAESDSFEKICLRIG